MRRLLLILLAVWCIIGVTLTAAALTGPSGWEVQPAPDAHGVIGMPLAGAADIAVIRTLLHDHAAVAGERWLVVLPAGADDTVLSYVRYQLAHLEYPRRVDVVTVQAVPEAVDYVGVITTSDIALAAPWRPVAERAGFTRHARTIS